MQDRLGKIGLLLSAEKGSSSAGGSQRKSRRSTPTTAVPPAELIDKALRGIEETCRKVSAPPTPTPLSPRASGILRGTGRVGAPQKCCLACACMARPLKYSIVSGRAPRS